VDVVQQFLDILRNPSFWASDMVTMHRDAISYMLFVTIMSVGYYAFVVFRLVIHGCIYIISKIYSRKEEAA